MTDCELRFSSSSVEEAGSFRLLELPPDLCNLVDVATHELPSLSIRGQPSEDAVLCTSDRTYDLRSVVLSNTILVVTAEDDAGNPVVRDQVCEILEALPSVPKLHKLAGMLRGMEYDDSVMDIETNGGTPRTRLSYQDARTQLQASDGELDRALRDKHILIIDGQLRPISPTYLHTILELLLNLLISLSLPPDAAPVGELTSILDQDHEIYRAVSEQVMSWFGSLDDGRWKMDAKAVVKEIGLGLLMNHKDDPIHDRRLIAQWKAAVGDTFEKHVSLDLLSGNYLLSPNFDLTYFPASSLPVEPAARFNDLFLTRSRWKSEDIAPFLADIAVNVKERDKLLLKFARATTDAEGVWYTARTKFSG